MSHNESSSASTTLAVIAIANTSSWSEATIGNLTSLIKAWCSNHFYHEGPSVKWSENHFYEEGCRTYWCKNPMWGVPEEQRAQTCPHHEETRNFVMGGWDGTKVSLEYPGGGGIGITVESESSLRADQLGQWLVELLSLIQKDSSRRPGQVDRINVCVFFPDEEDGDNVDFDFNIEADGQYTAGAVVDHLRRCGFFTKEPQQFGGSRW